MAVEALRPTEKIYIIVYLISINIIHECMFLTGPESLNQNIDDNGLRLSPSRHLQSEFLPKNNIPLIKKNQKKKGKIRFKCLHCDYLTFRKQNLIGHLRQKHEVSTSNIIFFSFLIEHQ